MQALKFNDGLWQLGYLGSATQEEIQIEPMLYRADLDYAEKNGGPLVRRVLPWLDSQHPWMWNHVSIDVKVTMLQPGWYPCIPGWHLDDFWRPTGQPALAELADNPSYHYMAVFGENSLTEFLTTPKEMPIYEELAGGKTVYGRYNEWIERSVWKRSMFVRENTLYEFSCLDFHRGRPATEAGWRCFVRATFSDHREPRNQIRSQVQVYVPLNALEAGW